jgi:hypothetical protein
MTSGTARPLPGQPQPPRPSPDHSARPVPAAIGQGPVVDLSRSVSVAWRVA